MELIEILILVVGISVMLTISYHFLTSSAESSTQAVIEEKEFSRVMDEIVVFFYEKVPIIDKNLAQILGDYLRWGEKPYILYGKYYGNLNVDAFVGNHFNSTFDQNWHLETSYKGKRVEFGFKVPEKTRLRTFIIRLPVPKALTDGEVIDVQFTQW
jgi:hypothetical protein